MPASSSVKSKRDEELREVKAYSGERELISLKPAQDWRIKSQHVPSENEDRENDVELKLP